MGWLSSFDPTSQNMEIPGMYLSDNGDKKPVPELHDRLMGVRQSLLVMESKQTPKRIIFYGNSGREYKFLVKGGEDLRIDERIQLLFKLMNELLASGTDQLQARTFKVIPVTTETGLLEWVDNTAPLESLITEEMKRDDVFLSKNPKVKKDGQTAAFDQRNKWIPWGGDPIVYHKNFREKTKTDAVAVWSSLQKTLPDDFLRRRFISMSYTAEIFHSRRTEFAKSCAVSSIYGYVCGIGDRHLKNLLIDK